ncbi:helix-turn-helix domain-containing protein, partial [Mycobacterium tuberculosis]|nr:helix-turn-helix domain-containing protein [Mycobacterium tuberculosis]
VGSCPATGPAATGTASGSGGGGSERALRQQFRQQTGMTINHYLRQLRICHAQYLLQHTERLIGDIAMQCGFEDSNYFSVVFSREIGMSPG